MSEVSSLLLLMKSTEREDAFVLSNCVSIKGMEMERGSSKGERHVKWPNSFIRVIVAECCVFFSFSFLAEFCEKILEKSEDGRIHVSSLLSLSKAVIETESSEADEEEEEEVNDESEDEFDDLLEREDAYEDDAAVLELVVLLIEELLGVFEV